LGWTEEGRSGPGLRGGPQGHAEATRRSSLAGREDRAGHRADRPEARGGGPSRGGARAGYGRAGPRRIEEGPAALRTGARGGGETARGPPIRDRRGARW